MKKNMKNIAIYAAMTIAALSLTSCGSGSEPTIQENTPVTTTTVAETTTATPLLVLSIGTKDSLKSFDYFYEAGAPGSDALSWDSNNPDADDLIAILADHTGWNLTLSNPVSVSPGSFYISFAKESSVYTGAASAESEFAIADQKELVTTILDSIVANMNNAYSEELTIYFTAADGGDIVVPGTDMVISSSEAYSAPVEEE